MIEILPGEFDAEIRVGGQWVGTVEVRTNGFTVIAASPEKKEVVMYEKEVVRKLRRAIRSKIVAQK
jgi:hypothetical protein